MSTKKLLTYEGLEEYNTKWHERVQNMVIGSDEMDELWEDVINAPPSVNGPSLVCRPKPSKPYNNSYYNIDDQFDLTLKFINNGNTSVALVEFAILYFITDSNPWNEYGNPRIAVIEPGESYSFVVSSLNVSEYDVSEGILKIEIPYSYSTDLEKDSYDYSDKINIHEYYELKPISAPAEELDNEEIDTSEETPIQNNQLHTSDTIYLAFGNSFVYEPMGSGVKLISVVNSRSQSINAFQLEIVNGGEFPIEWADNIQWENDAEPSFVPYHTDVLKFRSYNFGKTWIGQVVSTTEITPYWRLSVEIQDSNYSTPIFMIPITKNAIEYVDWGDGTIEEGTFAETEDSFIYHDYGSDANDEYIITIKSTKFSTGYIATRYANAGNVKISDSFVKILEIHNPLPRIKGSYQPQSDSYVQVDNTITGFFYYMQELKRIPDKMFHNNPNFRIDGHQCFYECENLQSVADGMFSNMIVEGSNFNECFAKCYAIRSVPGDFFSRNSSAASFDSTFYNCNKLESIPDGLFDGNASATSFNQCFYGCSSLTSIPAGLFDNNASATNFSSCFQGCYLVKSIPAGLFDNNASATNFSSCFSTCRSIQSIPSGLFNYAVNAETFESCFSSCIALQSIPSGLFANNLTAGTFNKCFKGCQSLAAIPSNLFGSGAAATTFEECFYGCKALEALPSGLFSGATAATSFKYTFGYCDLLSSIASNIFSTNTNALDFSYCFAGCKALVEIPSGLFDSNTLVKYFDNCFAYCRALQTIPVNLFAYNTGILTMTYAFYDCTNLGNFEVRIGSTKVSNAYRFVTKKTGTTRTVYVPADTTTRNSFNSIASSSGLTVVAE